MVDSMPTYCLQGFLSTLPGRGAAHQGVQHCGRRRISIHAPREGSGLALPQDAPGDLDFYPRSPGGERPEAAPCASMRNFSIHAPREGSGQTPVQGGGNKREFSIHAPREGSGRQSVAAASARIFSIHAPREGSGAVRERIQRDKQFSIHAPREGSGQVPPASDMP